MSLQHSAGYLYIASNASMPGFIKAGRTQTSVDDRLRCLYSTGVPCPFVAERVRFFIDCFTAEQSFFNALSGRAKRCENREFFLIDKETAGKLLDELYRNQHCLFGEDIDFQNFEGAVEECFRKLHRLSQSEFAEQIVHSLEILPYSHREALKLSLLGYVLTKRDESFAWWLTARCGVDPEEPIKCPLVNSGINNYYLTAYEYTIYSRLASFERYLTGIGCRACDSLALCYAVDTLINGNTMATEKVTQFAIELIERGANPQRILNVQCFAQAPIASRDFRFDTFPRNSNLSCADVIKNLAPNDERFSKIYQHIVNPFISKR